jgi:hypothetical protein
MIKSDVVWSIFVYIWQGTVEYEFNIVYYEGKFNYHLLNATSKFVLCSFIMFLKLSYYHILLINFMEEIPSS